ESRSGRRRRGPRGARDPRDAGARREVTMAGPKAAGVLVAACLLAAGCRGRPPMPPIAASPAAAPPRYVDVTEARGLSAVAWCGSPSKDHLLESLGTGAAFVDVDGDGHDDILLLDAWRLADRMGSDGPRP